MSMCSKMLIVLFWAVLLPACSSGPWDNPFSPDAADYQVSPCKEKITCNSHCETSSPGQLGDDAKGADRTCTYSCSNGASGDFHSYCPDEDCDAETSAVEAQLASEISCPE